MKNVVNRFTTRITLVLTVFGLFGCEKEEPVKEPEKGKYKTTVQAWPTAISSYLESDGKDYVSADVNNVTLEGKFEGATVRLFGSETDYLLNENPVHEFLTSNTQKDTIIYDFEETYYWVRVQKGALNNLRGARVQNRVKMDNTIPCCDLGIRAAMSTTPTKLRITVLDQGVPVKGADVQLYFSESDYVNNLPAQSNREEIVFSYGTAFAAGWQPEDRLKKYFNELSDTKGEVYFYNLEPKQYWIRVTKGGKSNSAGVIKTFASLPDNADITTTLTIGIN